MAGLAPSSAAPTSLLAPGATAEPSSGLAPSLLLPPSSGSVVSQITGGSSGGWRVTTDPQYSVLDDTITVYEVEDEEALIALMAAL